MKKGISIYSKRQKWKLSLFIAAIIIGLASLFYTNKLVKELATEERNKVELWAEATNMLIKSDVDDNQDMTFYLKVITNNNTVPVILANEDNEIITTRNLDPDKSENPEYLQRQIKRMQEENDPIEIDLGNNKTQKIYYSDSILLTQLSYYPFIQIGVIFLFIFVSYLALNSSMKAEQNQVWVGMAKETAHQLGTPITSLIAWMELLDENLEDKKLLNEVKSDVNRLEKITERFSKIGASPELKPTNISKVLLNSINYIKSRTSEKIAFSTNFSENDDVIAPVNSSLFEWVIENICKNAVDAMKGAGEINVEIADYIQVVFIDITDSGKGISKNKFKTIFRPGYTTKQRGWGLGLSLTKRIIEEYHSGKIFVRNSEINNGTTIRIVLKK